MALLDDVMSAPPVNMPEVSDAKTNLPLYGGEFNLVRLLDLTAVGGKTKIIGISLAALSKLFTSDLVVGDNGSKVFNALIGRSGVTASNVTVTDTGAGVFILEFDSVNVTRTDFIAYFKRLTLTIAGGLSIAAFNNIWAHNLYADQLLVNGGRQPITIMSDTKPDEDFDSTEGYAVGDIVRLTTNMNEWIATDVTEGEAVWKLWRGSEEIASGTSATEDNVELTNERKLSDYFNISLSLESISSALGAGSGTYIWNRTSMPMDQFESNVYLGLTILYTSARLIDYGIRRESDTEISFYITSRDATLLRSWKVRGHGKL